MSEKSPFPPYYVITPEPPQHKPMAHFLSDLERTLEKGFTLVQLRAKTLTPSQYLSLVEQALACCERHGARMLLNAPVEVAASIGADGIHLTSTRLMACTSRPLPASFIIAASCHDETQVAHATRLGADLLTISPVLPTATHTSAVPLGWPRFHELAALTTIPAYALGGLHVDMLDDARAAGAAGIAAIRGLWAGVVERS